LRDGHHGDLARAALTQTRTRIFNTLNQLAQVIDAAGTPAVTTASTYASISREHEMHRSAGIPDLASEAAGIK
jgi:hypothetical protein